MLAVLVVVGGQVGGCRAADANRVEGRVASKVDGWVSGM